ncbi:electron transfer flavoprotein subunit alpha/FixB family protein [Salsipaludibacter albus]|uniref:electron transfer flavoprotein subunit alpha/FixB family protein n=1 Tax=Salsipaludibacter albus TaxID=2849650 RepID=UPI001EE42B00|nr:electron transfer flavoprotein subunit alpha/FixB family protein [Salsipaludibacter albus]MBY5163081.1 electron transfer flavoprotein subunit alpha/FixB family protein [Salsipaludibacter albus]
MSCLLVLIDHAEGTPRKVSLQMLTAARRLAAETGDSVAAAWFGEDADDAMEALGAGGVETLYWWDDPDADAYVTLPKVEALEAVLDTADVSAILFASSNHTKDVAARLAIRRDGGVITDVTDLAVEDGTIVATKEVFGGATITQSKVADGKLALFGVSPNAFPVEEGDGGEPEVVDLDVELSESATAARVTDVEKEASADRPDIGEAAIVVAGGRGLGSEDGFELMEELADVLGAGVGASRAATDAGWYPHRYQIGQTGRTISPMLYIGSGISGAIQHRAGMQTSQNIVAINKDAEAPIFQIADFGIVGDLYDVVPALVEELRARTD